VSVACPLTYSTILSPLYVFHNFLIGSIHYLAFLELPSNEKRQKAYAQPRELLVEMKIMSSEIEPFDIVNMLGEIKAIREKYGMQKGLIFVPDKLSISIERISYDNFHLSYAESFNYLSSEVLDMVVPVSINMLVQMGFPRERVTRISENSVGIEMDGDLLLILGLVLSELFIQKRFEDTEISLLFDTVQKSRKAFTESADFEFEWNSDIEKRFDDIMSNTFKVMQEHPSIVSELEAVVKKYTQSNETSKSDVKDEPKS
jgi:hypothetical protein